MEIALNELNFKICNDKINGIYTNNYDKLIKLLSLDDSNTIVNKKILPKQELYDNKKNIFIVNEYFEYDNYKTIYELLLSIINEYNLYPRNINKKIIDAIKIVGLQEDILEAGLNELSSSEKKLIQIAISLLINTDTIVLVEPFKIMDLNNQKRIVILLKKLIDKYKKRIIIISNNIEIFLKYTNYLIIIKNNKTIIEGDTFEILKDVELLKKHHLDIPQIIEITYLARKKKNIKIDYFKDIRDIIKDIYKHV